MERHRPLECPGPTLKGCAACRPPTVLKTWSCARCWGTSSAGLARRATLSSVDYAVLRAQFLLADHLATIDMALETLRAGDLLPRHVNDVCDAARRRLRYVKDAVDDLPRLASHGTLDLRDVPAEPDRRPQ